MRLQKLWRPLPQFRRLPLRARPLMAHPLQRRRQRTVMVRVPFLRFSGWVQPPRTRVVEAVPVPAVPVASFSTTREVIWMKTTSAMTRWEKKLRRRRVARA